MQREGEEEEEEKALEKEKEEEEEEKEQVRNSTNISVVSYPRQRDLPELWMKGRVTQFGKAPFLRRKIPFQRGGGGGEEEGMEVPSSSSARGRECGGGYVGENKGPSPLPPPLRRYLPLQPQGHWRRDREGRRKEKGILQ